MSKTGKLILGVLLLAYLICFMLFKYSSSQGTAKQMLLAGTTIFSFSFRSNFSIFLLSVSAFYFINKFFCSIFKKKYICGLVFLFISLFCLILPGHFIATQADGSEMREYLFIYEIKNYEITDHWVGHQIAGGYDRKYHYNSDYPCFRYCDSFFVRHYQVSKNESFNVFNGIGPLFNFEDEDSYKN